MCMDEAFGSRFLSNFINSIPFPKLFFLFVVYELPSIYMVKMLALL